MSRKLCITAVDGHTGHLIAELLLTDEKFSKKIGEITGLTLHPNAARCKELANLGAKIITHKPGRIKDMVKVLKQTGADTICLIPPTHDDKYNITVELIEAAKKAGMQNVCFLSSAGCELADKKKQPRLHEFVELETLVLATKGETSIVTGHSPVVIRAGFYAENLLLYAPQVKEDGIIPLPIGEDHKFAPIALGVCRPDVAQVTAHVLSGYGKHGFSDKHRGQLIVLTGPMLASGAELAMAASQALSIEIQFEAISQYEAKKVLHTQSDANSSELQYLLDYYSLVREGKTNYTSTLAFHAITGMHPEEPVEFFKVYAQEFEGGHEGKRRKIAHNVKQN